MVNEAYETLGKPKERREYNKKLRMEAARDIKSQYYHPDLVELQNAPLTYSLCVLCTIGSAYLCTFIFLARVHMSVA